MAHLGLIGIGVMGASFALNLAEKGHTVSLFDRHPDRMQAVTDDALADNMPGAALMSSSLADFVRSIPAPRAILVLVPAAALDAVIADLQPLLETGDMIADMGNSHFRETERRATDLGQVGLRFLGIGISGGAEGARNGPSIMVGGPKESWDIVRQPLTDAAAVYDGIPCCDRFGPGGAGHFVKMLHNGIEYAVMQMIAEIYGIMRDGLAMDAGDIADVFDDWNAGRMESYLIEIAAEVSAAIDPKTSQPVLDIILDQAGQKGTGRWSVIEALHLGQPAGMMTAAVDARNMSADGAGRLAMEQVFGPAPKPLTSGKDHMAIMEAALRAATICAYAQGLEVIQAASDEFDWNIDMGNVARVWRAGCIIRSASLDAIASVFDDGGSANLALSEPFLTELQQTIPALRQLVSVAALGGHPVPAFQSALSYHEIGRTGRSTANMLQGLRDYFGAHGFTRTDNPEGGAHGPWLAR